MTVDGIGFYNPHNYCSLAYSALACFSMGIYFTEREEILTSDLCLDCVTLHATAQRS